MCVFYKKSVEPLKLLVFSCVQFLLGHKKRPIIFFYILTRQKKDCLSSAEFETFRSNQLKLNFDARMYKTEDPCNHNDSEIVFFPKLIVFLFLAQIDKALYYFDRNQKEILLFRNVHLFNLP